MIPSCSSTRSRSASVLGLMPWHECSSSENRRGPSERSCTSRAVHFAPITSAQAATAHVVASWIGFIVRTATTLSVLRVSAGSSEFLPMPSPRRARRVCVPRRAVLAARAAALAAERPRARVDLRNREARDRAEAARGGLARLRDPEVARNREKDERVLDGEAVLVHEQPRRLFRDELRCALVGV